MTEDGNGHGDGLGGGFWGGLGDGFGYGLGDGFGNGDGGGSGSGGGCSGMGPGTAMGSGAAMGSGMEWGGGISKKQSGKPAPVREAHNKETDKMAISYTAGNPNAGGVAKINPPGVYPLVITKADQKTSKAGNPMIALKFGVLKKDGSTSGAVYENLVFSESCFWKVDQLLAASGNHPGEGEPIELEAAEMVGWEVFAQLGVEKDNKNNDRNCVLEFLDATSGAAKLKEQAAKKAAAARAKAAAEADEEFA